jgi:hypothetical protein
MVDSLVYNSLSLRFRTSKTTNTNTRNRKAILLLIHSDFFFFHVFNHPPGEGPAWSMDGR